MKRIVLVAVVALTFACSSKPETPDGGGGGGGGSTGGGGGGGTVGNPDSGDSQAEIFCQQLAQSECASSTRCGYFLGVDESRCEAFFVTRDCAVELDGFKKGRLQFDATAASTCLTQTAAASCNSSDITACANVFVPSVATGGNCERDTECSDVNDVCQGAGCGRTCSAAGGLGQHCTRDFECDAGAWCGQDIKCHGPQGAGSFCDRNDQEHPQCAGNLYCELSTKRCSSLPSAGMPCANVEPRCTSGNWCDFTTGSGICQPFAPDNAACVDFAQCGPGASCFFNSNPARCHPQSGVDGGCINQADCQSPLVCYRQSCIVGGKEGESCDNGGCENQLLCDPVRQTCQRSRNDLPSGAPCSAWIESCDRRDEICKGSALNPDGGVGTLGACGAKAVGDSCQSSDQCPRGSYCSGAGTTATCVGSDAGTACDSDDRCPADYFCPFSLGARNCIAKLDAGTPCNNAQECVAGAQCRATADGGTFCLPPANPGEFCTNTFDCGGFQACKGNTCTPAGAVGEPCILDFYCITGHCQDLSDGGTHCYAPLAAGAFCGNDTECASLACSEECQQICP